MFCSPLVLLCVCFFFSRYCQRHLQCWKGWSIGVPVDLKRTVVMELGLWLEFLMLFTSESFSKKSTFAIWSTLCFLRHCLQIFGLVIVLKARSSGSNVKLRMSCTNNAKEVSHSIAHNQHQAWFILVKFGILMALQ